VWVCGFVCQQMLEEVCLKNGWGIPTYELHEVVGGDSTFKLYVYKVSCFLVADVSL